MRVNFLVALLLAVPACTITTLGPHSEHASESALEHEPDNVDAATVARVRVLQNESMPCATEVLGTVDVHEEMKNEAQALGVLRRRAAALGAEAVVGVEFHHGEGKGEETHLSGMAVRCKDLIQGREYLVLGDVAVSGEMGHEQQAFQALRTRARELQADLIIGIHFEHGEGEGQPTRLTGKAIRFRSTSTDILR